MRKVACLLALLLLCSGCAAMLERDYLSVTSIEPQYHLEDDATVVRAEAYDDVVAAMIYFVENHADTGTVRLYNYAADEIDADLRAARREVEEQTPFAAYAVDYITTDVVSVVSYVEVTVYITYRRSVEQISAMRMVIGAAAIEKAIATALVDYPQEVVLQVGRYDMDLEHIAQLTYDAYMSNPAYAMGFPAFEMYVYPLDGDAFQPIIELIFSYPRSEEEMRTMAQELEEFYVTLDLTDIETEEDLRAWYSDYVELGAQEQDTALHALKYGAANEEGQELGWRYLCQKLELEEYGSWRSPEEE